MLRPFSHPNFFRNEAQCGADDEPCAICGLPVKKESKVIWVAVGDGNSRFLTPKEVSKYGDAGVFPVGNTCYRRHKKELHKYKCKQ